jgi:predicted metal-dependent peptidase
MSSYQHSQRATKALQKMAESDISYSSLTLWCHHVDKDDLIYGAPAATDGKTVFYGIKFAEFTLAEQQGVAAHELSHVAWRHQSRGKQLRSRFGADFRHKIFNIATDAIINEMLIAAGYTLPRPCVILTEIFKDVFKEDITVEDALSQWDAEQLYIRLMNLREKPENKTSGGNDKKPEKSSGSQSQGQGQGQGQDQHKLDADAIRRMIEEWAEERGFAEDFDSEGEHTPQDAADDAEWQQRIARAIDLGKLAGRGLGALKFKLADIPKSRTPWEVMLRTAVTKAVTKAPRPSWEKPTRRWLAMESDAIARGVEVPGYEQGFVKKTDIPRVVIGFDTSGSIWSSPELLRMFAGEVAGVGRRTGAEIHVIVFDDGVHSITKLDGMDWYAEAAKMKIEGGGGTSFVEVIEEAKKLDPSIIVMLTDLYGTFPAAPGKIPVIWASPESNPPSAPFGRVISMGN